MGFLVPLISFRFILLVPVSFRCRGFSFCLFVFGDFSVISFGDLPVTINVKPRRQAREADNERILQLVSRINPRVIKCDLLRLRISNIAK